jgi:hypothetical protein
VKINGLALIFDTQPCELRSLNAECQHIGFEPVNAQCPRVEQRLLAPQIESGFGPPQFSAAFRLSDP